MDPNGHINNVAYLAWALEVIPEHTCQDCQLTEVCGSNEVEHGNAVFCVRVCVGQVVCLFAFGGRGLV